MNGSTKGDYCSTYSLYYWLYSRFYSEIYLSVIPKIQPTLYGWYQARSPQRGYTARNLEYASVDFVIFAPSIEGMDTTLGALPVPFLRSNMQQNNFVLINNNKTHTNNTHHHSPPYSIFASSVVLFCALHSSICSCDTLKYKYLVLHYNDG